MTATIIDGTAIAAKVRAEVAAGTAVYCAQRGSRPGLATVLVGENPASQIYVAAKQKVCAEVGEGEKVYDVTGLHFEKLRSDFFRHVVLGMGSGDLVVHTSGADSREFRFDNVLNIDKKIKDIEALISAKRQVTMAHV